MCIDKVPSNRYNFIRWHKATGQAVSGLGNLEFCAADPSYLPNTIVQYDRKSYPVIIEGKDISFYANLTDSISDADFADWTLSVFDGFGNNIDDDIAVIVKDEYADLSYRFYVSSFSLSLTKGTYRFVIYNSSNNTVKYVSNCFKYRAAADIVDCVYMSYRHSSTLFDFNYSTLTSFRNKVFIEMNDIEDQPEIELTPYPEVTTGQVRTSKTYSKLVRNLETKHFDFEDQLAMLGLSGHDDILMNGNSYTVKDVYQSIPSRGNSLKKGTISFYDDSVSTINFNGYNVV